MNLSVVELALSHVREFFPNVSIVIYNTSGMWCYMDEDFDAPNFEDINIDIGLLESAADSLTKLPFIYQI